MRSPSLSWSGARQGFITSGLNHVMHAGARKLGEERCPNCNYKKGKYFDKKPKHTKNEEYWKKAVSIDEWLKNNNGKTLREIQAYVKFADDRYVIHPNNGSVMDMRHVLNVGYRPLGIEFGWFVEIIQAGGYQIDHESKYSAFHKQDYFSIRIGSSFHFKVSSEFSNRYVERNFAPYFTEWLNTGNLNNFYGKYWKY